MSKKLSATMAIALAEASEHGGELVCWRGGFWTYPNCTVAKDCRHLGRDYRVPTWYVGTETLKALATRGMIEFTERTESGYPIRAKVCAAPPLSKQRRD